MAEVGLKVGVPEAKTDGKIEIDLEFLAEVVIKLMKRDIFERYKRTGEITDEDWKFCEKIDWHPVDEFPLKREHVEELKKALEEAKIGKTYTSTEEFWKELDSK